MTPSNATAAASKSLLLQESRRIASQFEFPAAEVNRNVEAFLGEMKAGLDREGTHLSQIPTHVTAVPDGSEKGLYLAVDLGGTNFRVCSVFLRGDSDLTIRHTKLPIPHALMTAASYRDIFAFMTDGIDAFLREHLREHWTSHLEQKRAERRSFVDEEMFDLGFTFSYPVRQNALNSGELVRWTKGFDVADAVGRDVCGMLQEALDERHLPVRVTALVNDAVGTLMTRAYTSRDGRGETLMGAIFGTGTNGAYVESVAKIGKLKGADRSSTGRMIVNVEWGSFDNDLSVLPNTSYDVEVNAASNNPGVHMFEKRVSGMYLGDITRRVIRSLTQYTAAPLFASSSHRIPPDSPLYQPHGIDTSFMSAIEADNTPHLTASADHIQQALHLPAAPGYDDCLAVRAIVHAIGKRSARLSAVAVAAVIVWTRRLQSDGAVDIGADGTLVELYPGYQEMMREALGEVAGIGREGESRVSVGIAKDGSGVGAALGALIGAKARE